jgi:dipeptidyl aminopeptidase/acylaminoacyl peptidase
MQAPSRRELMTAGAGALAAATLAACGGRSRPGQTATVGTTPSRPQRVRHSYGADPSQFGELYAPAGTRRPGTVVIIHGGFWRAQYDLSLGAPLAADLVARGYTVWNLEYRRVGDGGGWLTTSADIAAGIDQLETVGVDTSRVVAIGHSAGGQLAVWAAGRSTVALTAVVAQAGVLDLATAADTGVGGTAVPDFLGGSPAQLPARYAEADPIQRVPAPVPVLCVHGRADANVPFAQSTAYVAAAQKAGGRATLAEVPGDHFSLIDPTSVAWQTVVDALPGLMR